MMQNDPKGYSEKRCLYYWSRIYSNAIKKKQDYKTLKKTICLWFLNEDVYKEVKQFENRWTIQCENKKLKGHFDEMEIRVFELQKFRNDGTIKPSKKNFWLWFLDHTNEEMLKLAYEKYKEILEARKELEKITEDPEVRNELIRLDMATYDYTSAIADAKRERCS